MTFISPSIQNDSEHLGAAIPFYFFGFIFIWAAVSIAMQNQTEDLSQANSEEYLPLDSAKCKCDDRLLASLTQQTRDSHLNLAFTHVAQEVAGLLQRSYPEKLYITVGTVKTHRNILKKLCVNTYPTPGDPL